MPRHTDVTFIQRLTCRLHGHLMAVQQFDFYTHKMTLICNRCRITQTTTSPIVKVMPDYMSQPKASEH